MTVILHIDHKIKGSSGDAWRWLLSGGTCVWTTVGHSFSRTQTKEPWARRLNRNTNASGWHPVTSFINVFISYTSEWEKLTVYERGGLWRHLYTLILNVQLLCSSCLEAVSCSGRCCRSDSLLPLSVELQLLLMVLVWFWRVTRTRTCSRCCTEQVQDQQLQLLIIMRCCLVSLWGRVGPEKGSGSVLVLCSSDGFSQACGSGLIV